jgi:hypothetical protein
MTEKIKNLMSVNSELISAISFIPQMASAREMHPDVVDKRWLCLGDANKEAKLIWREFYESIFGVPDAGIPINTRSNYFCQYNGKDLFITFVEWWLRKNKAEALVEWVSAYENGDNYYTISQGGYPSKKIRIHPFSF